MLPRATHLTTSLHAADPSVRPRNVPSTRPEAQTPSLQTCWPVWRHGVSQPASCSGLALIVERPGTPRLSRPALACSRWRRGVETLFGMLLPPFPSLKVLVLPQMKRRTAVMMPPRSRAELTSGAPDLLVSVTCHQSRWHCPRGVAGMLAPSSACSFCRYPICRCLVQRTADQTWRSVAVRSIAEEVVLSDHTVERIGVQAQTPARWPALPDCLS